MRWGVVATIDEPGALCAGFVAHYLRLGAAEVHVFLDIPDPATSCLLTKIENLRVISCDDAYWAAHPRGSRPPRHTARQKANASAVYRRRRLDWLLHCDADEFLQTDPGADDVASLLAAADPAMDYLTVPVAERILPAAPVTIFDGGFRLPGAEARPEPLSGCLSRGLTGHVAGKAFVRCGRGWEMGVHFPVPGTQPARHAPLSGARLLHFDGLTPLHLAMKLLRRARERYPGPPRPHGSHRICQFTEMARRVAAGEGWEPLARDLMSVGPEVGGPELGGLVASPNIAAAVAGLFGPEGVDLSPAAFDAVLRQRAPELSTELPETVSPI